MFDIFNPPFRYMRNKIVLPKFDYINEQMRANLLKVSEHYGNNTYASSIVSRLYKTVMMFKEYLDLSPERLYRLIESQSPRICGALGIYSPLVHGKVHYPGEWYNRNCHDIMISVNYPADINLVTKNYRVVKAVRVLCHDFSDFGYGLPDGNYFSSESGMVGISIDLPLLAVQYQQWYYNNLSGGVAKNNTANFIMRYVISNMLSTHLDVVVFNRLCNMVNGKPNAATRNQQSFYLTDYSARYDSALLELIDRFKKQPMDWMTRLNNIPSIEYGSYLQSVTMPDMAPTRQVKWAMVAVKLSMVEFLIATDKLNEGSLSMNSSNYGDLERQLRYLVNDKAPLIGAPQDVMTRATNILAEITKQG